MPESQTNEWKRWEEQMRAEFVERVKRQQNGHTDPTSGANQAPRTNQPAAN